MFTPKNMIAGTLIVGGGVALFYVMRGTRTIPDGPSSNSGINTPDCKYARAQLLYYQSKKPTPQTAAIVAGLQAVVDACDINDTAIKRRYLLDQGCPMNFSHLSTMNQGVVQKRPDGAHACYIPGRLAKRVDGDAGDLNVAENDADQSWLANVSCKKSVALRAVEGPNNWYNQMVKWLNDAGFEPGKYVSDVDTTNNVFIFTPGGPISYNVRGVNGAPSIEYWWQGGAVNDWTTSSLPGAPLEPACMRTIYPNGL